MAKKPSVKCPYCSLYFDRDKEEYVQIKNRYAHKTCHEEALNSISEEEKALKELEEYIKKLFKEEFVSPRVRNQIKRMRETYNYTYSGILKSLVYFFEVKKNSVEKANNGIGIVPYVYTDAYNYYLALYEAQMRNENKEVKNYVAKGMTVVIKPPERKPKLRKLFNLEEEE